MSTRTIFVVVLALICGVCAAVGIQGMRKAPVATATPVAVPVAKESVVIVVGAVPQGEILKSGDVELREVPKDSVPPGALTQTSAAVGRRAQIAMVKGDTLTDRMLVSPEGGRLSPRVKPGLRAFTITASGPSSSLAGAVDRGDRVDILFTRTNQTSPGAQMIGARATILFQNVEILAVNPKDESILANKLAPHEVLSATLAVKPEQAAILDQAQATGILHLALRSPDDTAMLSPPEALADRVEAGKRAFTIQTQSYTAMMAGFLLPGNFVDILHTPKSSGGPTEKSGIGGTRTILEAVRILAVHTKLEQPPSNQFEPVEVLSITLLVDPQEAEVLEQAQNSGTLGLMLRNPEDLGKSPLPMPSTTLTESTQRTRTLRGTRYGSDRVTTRTIVPPPPPPAGE